MEFVFPRSYSILDLPRELLEVLDNLLKGQTAGDNEDPEQVLQKGNVLEVSEEVQIVATNDDDAKADELPSLTGIRKTSQQEEALWTDFLFSQFLTGSLRSNGMIWDVGKKGYAVVSPLAKSVRSRNVELGERGKPYATPEPEKDIGFTPLQPPPSLPHQLQTKEQNILQEIKSVIKFRHVREKYLEFSTRLVIDKAIEKEKANYEGRYEEF